MLGGVEEMPEPRWLDEDQQQTWISLVAMMLRLPAALDAQLQRDAGISAFEYQALSEVRRLVFDHLTKAQQRQLRDISQRIMRAITQDDG